jgi:hypothetical protein
MAVKGAYGGLGAARPRAALPISCIVRFYEPHFAAAPEGIKCRVRSIPRAAVGMLRQDRFSASELDDRAADRRTPWGL